MEDGKYSSEHNVTFSELAWHERVWEFAKFIPSEAPIVAAVAASLWGFSEILIATMDSSARGSSIAIPVLGISASVAFYRAYVRFKKYVPEPLRSESETSQSIFRRQKCGWQFDLARRMLLDRIAVSESTFDRIDRGADYVEPVILKPTQYLKWLGHRPESFLRLSHAIATICTNDLPNVLGDTKSEKELSAVKEEVDALGLLYEELMKQEVDCYRYVSPEELENIHRLTYGWSKTIRDGVHQFLDILDRLAKIDSKKLADGKVKPPEFNFVFESPPEVEAFSNALTEVDPELFLH